MESRRCHRQKLGLGGPQPIKTIHTYTYFVSKVFWPFGSNAPWSHPTSGGHVRRLLIHILSQRMDSQHARLLLVEMALLNKERILFAPFRRAAAASWPGLLLPIRESHRQWPPKTCVRFKLADTSSPPLPHILCPPVVLDYTAKLPASAPPRQHPPSWTYTLLGERGGPVGCLVHQFHPDQLRAMAD
jgi:hypothetical protein